MRWRGVGFRTEIDCYVNLDGPVGPMIWSYLLHLCISAIELR
jgi:hypothetical protein